MDVTSGFLQPLVKLLLNCAEMRELLDDWMKTVERRYTWFAFRRQLQLLHVYLLLLPCCFGNMDKNHVYLAIEKY